MLRTTSCQLCNRTTTMLPHKRACNDAVTLGNSTGQLDLPVNVTLTSLADLPLLKVLSYVPGTDLGAVARVCTRLYALTRGHWSVWRGKQACFSFKDHEGLLALLRVTPPSWESLEVCMADPKLRWDHKDIPDPDPKENYNVAKVIEGGRTLSLSLLSETLAVTVIQEFGQRRIKNLSIELHDVRRRDLFFSSLHQATSLETINVKWSWPPSCEGWEPQSYRASSRWPQGSSDWSHGPIPASKAAKEAQLQDQIPFYLNKFEQIVKENNGFLVNGNVHTCPN
ncbi:hypothetical protein FOCC_FOCC006998 [Frankliniella occidentalis]|nr:hypothetical protein FOCC_FOCC006998 [Frankliniella occidentalis]